nr:MAG TPA: hypothetical protein [Myoviridae sp. ctyhU11]
MFEVNDIPPIDGWELQELIAENVQHEEFLFFRFYAGDEQDYFGPDSYTKRYECFCTTLTASVRSACRSFSRRFRRTRMSLRKCGQR